MSDPRIAADGRDDDANDRDDVADDRDDTAGGRDDDAIQRDTDAAVRDDSARQDFDDLDESLGRLSEQVLDHLVRIENAELDLDDDWPELTAAAVARLDAHAVEQRRLAGLARYGVTTLINELRQSLTGLRHDRRAAARDRIDAADDRRDAAGDRRDAGHDRDAAQRDRNQSAIDRQQVDPRDLPPFQQEQLNSPTAEAIATSRQRIADSHDILTATRDTLDDIQRQWERPPDDSERSPERDH